MATGNSAGLNILDSNPCHFLSVAVPKHNQILILGIELGAQRHSMLSRKLRLTKVFKLINRVLMGIRTARTLWSRRHISKLGIIAYRNHRQHELRIILISIITKVCINLMPLSAGIKMLPRRRGLMPKFTARLLRNYWIESSTTSKKDILM